MKYLPIRSVLYAAAAFFAVCVIDACKKGNFPNHHSVSAADSIAADSIAALDSMPSFNEPTGVAVDAAGNIYVADYGNDLIRKITPQGVVGTFAGSGNQGYADGTGLLASFAQPAGIAIDAAGNLYVADSGNDLIRKISPEGSVTTIAGSDTSGYTDGTGSATTFFDPLAVAVGASGDIYVADAGNNLIRKISTGGAVTTFAGTYNTATSTQRSPFNNPSGVAVNRTGNLFVANYLNNTIMEVTPSGQVSTYAGSGLPGAGNGPAATASFYFPNSVATDTAGNVYVSDGVNNLIRKISPQGIVSTLAGNGTAGATDSTGTAASFNQPAGLALDAAGNVYVADAGNNLIRKISPGGAVTTVAGSGLQGARNGMAVARKNKTILVRYPENSPRLFSVMTRKKRS